MATAEKKKKLVVNLPKETLQDEKGQLVTRPEWARQPLPNQGNYGHIHDILAHVTTAEIYPPDAWRAELPDIIDVYLPGKVSIILILSYIPAHNLITRQRGKQLNERTSRKN